MTGQHIEVRKLSDGEVDGFSSCLDHAFGRRPPERLRELDNKAIGVERMIGAFVGSEVVGTAASYQLELTVPGLITVPMAGVSGVSVLPTHRRRGFLRRMMDLQLRDIYEHGEPLAGLGASEGGIYERFGYGVASYACNYRIDKHRARLREDIADLCPGTVKVITAGQAEELAPPLFEAARRLRTGEVNCLDLWWEGIFGEPNFFEADPKNRFFVAYEEDGRVDGYLDYSVRFDSGDRRQRNIELNVMVTVSLAAYAALWRYLLGVDLISYIEASNRPVDELLRHLLEDPRQLRTTARSDELWVRLVDVRAALEARRYPNAPGEVLVLDVRDANCSWNDGVYTLAVAGDGVASVTGPVPRGAAGTPDLTVDVARLGSFYLGGVRPSELARARRIQEHVPGKALRADLVFSGDGDPYSSVGF